MNQKKKVADVDVADGVDSRERRGLDLLAAAIDEVAENLPPSKLASIPPPSSSLEIPRRATRWRGSILAASLAITLLAWPSYLGLVRLPRAEQQLATARSLAARAGPVAMTWLSPARQGSRSAAVPPLVRVERPVSGSAVWLLELPVALRESLSAGARIELRQEASGWVEEWRIDGDDLMRQLATHDGVPILLLASALVPGDYRLSWLDETGRVVSSVGIQLVEP